MRHQGARVPQQRAIARTVVLWLWLVLGWGDPAFGEEMARQAHRSGDFTFAVGAPPSFVEPMEVAEHWDEPGGQRAPFAADARWRLWLTDTQVDRRGGKRVRYVD